MRSFVVYGLLFLLTVVFFAAPGCGKSKGGQDAEVKVDSDGTTTVKVTDESGETTGTYSANAESGVIKSADGTTIAFGKDAKVAVGFPKDIPIYPGAELQMSSADAANKTYVVQALSTDGVDKLAEYYKKEMKAQGWTEGDGTAVTGENPMQMLNFVKGESTALIVVTAQENKSLLSISTEQQ